MSELLNSLLGGKTANKGEQERSTGSLLVIGIVLFVLMGGLKLFQKPSDKTEDNAAQIK